jgi:hypothetical protein
MNKHVGIPAADLQLAARRKRVEGGEGAIVMFSRICYKPNKRRRDEHACTVFMLILRPPLPFLDVRDVSVSELNSFAKHSVTVFLGFFFINFPYTMQKICILYVCIYLTTL